MKTSMLIDAKKGTAARARLCLFAWLCVGLAAAAMGEEFNRNALLSPKGISMPSGGLLSASRLKMSQSYSMSYSSGSDQSSAWNGLYLNTLQYQFAVPVTLTLDLGFSHQPGALLGVGPVESGYRDGGFVLPRVELKYQPSRNMLIRLQYWNTQNMPSAPASSSFFGEEDLLITPKERFQ